MNSTMFRVKVDRREPTELHEQVAAARVADVIGGRMSNASSLPYQGGWLAAA